MKKVLIIALTAICFQANAQIDSVKLKSRDYVSVELDPAPFILGGYSFSLKYSLGRLENFALMFSMYGSDFPDGMMSKSNYEKGFRNLKIENSYALFMEYFLKDDRSGFYFGPSVFVYNKSVMLSAGSEQTNFKSVYPNLRAGFVYKPFKKSGFYLNPWFNFGKEYMIDDNNSIDGIEYTSDKISYILALHLGYRLSN